MKKPAWSGSGKDSLPDFHPAVCTPGEREREQLCGVFSYKDIIIFS